MNDEVLSKLSILKPQNALSLTYRETSPSLIPLIKVVPRMIENDSLIQKIDDQWRSLPIALAKHPNEDIINLSVDTFWQVKLYLFAYKYVQLKELMLFSRIFYSV